MLTTCCISGPGPVIHRSDWEENCVADARQVRVLGVCWGAGKIPKRLEVLVPRVKPTGLDGWEKIKVAPHYLVLVQSQHQAYTVANRIIHQQFRHFENTIEKKDSSIKQHT